MADPDHSEPLPDSIGKKARPLKECVAGDPNDDAFSLVRAIVSFCIEFSVRCSQIVSPQHFI